MGTLRAHPPLRTTHIIGRCAASHRPIAYRPTRSTTRCPALSTRHRVVQRVGRYGRPVPGIL
eukprot:3928044-Rhodomonas_salina.2